ncbi:two-component system regulatory protein YycI [Serpentinicella alkaliphila]|uniref:Regulatory protein YycI of two-component signal transduction system YycFG n=1 Tax=Serpentinicella alkaliphila TaxID=1734049 RepID=A0A4R2TM04_9FIRM|nr:two-component system regulatory protein YycI [Serpentinicella alkaliphila]QUH25183.1 two-component system regulatory protein YycI [Serpentinicella alkaliphila]TCQ02275.1 regulatory protein YycI of two-component signal transduction system YycFG [Serpentinicella alkaliphila]
MDWSKAKNILIIAFIITNLFLLFNIEKDIMRQENFFTITNKYVEEVKAHLNENGIKVNTEIPLETQSLPVLFVKYNTFNIEEIGPKLLGEYTEIDNNTYASESGIVNIVGGKKITYKRTEKCEPIYSLDENKAKTISEDFLLEHNLNFSQLHLSQIYFGKVVEFGDNPVYILVYEQLYNNHFLGESYINVYVNKHGIIGFEAMLLEYDKTYPQKRKIIPATEALLRKINDMVNDNPYDDIIVNNIELGYYFDPESVNVADWRDIESGTAFPTWRITLNNGKTYYVEGYKN